MSKKKNQSIQMYYIAILFLAVSFFVLNFLLRQGGEQRTEAAGETISLQFNPSSINATSGNVFTSAIQLKPSASFSARGFDIKITFSSNQVEVTDITYESPAVVSLGLGDDNTRLAQVNQRGIINLQGEVQNPSGMALSNSTFVNAVSLGFRSKTSSAFSITVDTGGTKAYKINADKSIEPVAMTGGATLSVNGGGSNPTPTPTTGGGGNPTATPTVGGGNPTNTPTPGTGNPTRTPTPGTGNPTRTPTPGTGNPTRTPTPGSGNPTATPTIAGGNPTRTPTPGTGNPTRTPTPGTGNPTRTPTPGTGNPTATPTITQTGNVSVDLTLKFQGVLKKPTTVNSIQVKVTLTDGPLGEQSQSRFVNFTAQEGGKWTGAANFNAPAGSGYKVLVKGPKHIQKRVCDRNPSETYGGTYRCSDEGRISLQEGSNNLDFSNIILLTGDLPDQNSVVDSYDISFLRLNLGKSDSNVVAVADLNYDGIVDTQDYALLIASLNIKYDEL